MNKGIPSFLYEGFVTTPDPTLMGIYTTLNTAIGNQKAYNNVIQHLTDADSKVGVGNATGIVQERQVELQNKIQTLKKDIQRKYQIIQTNNRDFIDYSETDGKTDTSQLLSIEDYTVFVFLISYLFLAGVFIYTYTYSVAPELMVQTFGKALLGTIFVSIIGGMVFYSTA